MSMSRSMCVAVSVGVVAAGAAPEAMAAAELIRTREDAEKAAQGRGFGSSVILAQAAAWSPNPANPPLYFDLPMKDGLARPEIVARWGEYDGDHTNKVAERIEMHVLPFFSNSLSFSAKTTATASTRR